MKFSCESKELLEPFALIHSIIPSTDMKPVLKTSLVKIRQNTLQLQATDLEIGIDITMENVETEGDGKVLFPVDKVLQILRFHQNETIDFRVEDNNIEIACNNSKYKLFSIPPDQFPAFPSYSTEVSLEVSLEKFQNMIAKTIYVVSEKVTPVVLTGILLKVQNKKLKMGSTDTRRFSLIEEKISSDIERTCIIPPKVLRILSRINKEGNIKIFFNENSIVFKIDNIILISRIIEGNYPELENFIPKSFNTTVKVNIEEFKKAINKAKITMGEERQIKFEFVNNSISIGASSTDTGESSVKIECKKQGSDLTILFNPEYILDVLESLEDEEITMNFISAEDRMYVKEKNFQAVVMPVRLL